MFVCRARGACDRGRSGWRAPLIKARVSAPHRRAALILSRLDPSSSISLPDTPTPIQPPLVSASPDCLFGREARTRDLFSRSRLALSLSPPCVANAERERERDHAAVSRLPSMPRVRGAARHVWRPCHADLRCVFMGGVPREGGKLSSRTPSPLSRAPAPRPLTPCPSRLTLVGGV